MILPVPRGAQYSSPNVTVVRASGGPPPSVLFPFPRLVSKSRPVRLPAAGKNDYITTRHLLSTPKTNFFFTFLQIFFQDRRENPQIIDE